MIDKAAVVAEIERRIESCAKQREDMLNVQCHALADDASARMGELNCIQDFLDTLEVKEADESRYNGFLGKELKMVDDEIARLEKLKVKEVDLDKELDTWRHNHFHGRRDKDASGEYLERSSQLDIAKHFFELGMQVSNKALKREKV